MPRNRLHRILKKTNKQNKPGETIKKTSSSVSPARVNKWFYSILATR